MRIELDSHGRLSPAAAVAWRAELRRLFARAPRELSDAAAYLGSFDGLPPATQAAVVRQIAADAAARLRWRTLGRWHERLLHALYVLGAQPRLGRRARKLVAWVDMNVRDGAHRLASTLRAAVLRAQGRWSRRPSLAAAYAAAGLSLQYLGATWAQGVPVDRRTRAFWHDRERTNVYGYDLGLDLLQADGKWYFLEANLDAAPPSEKSDALGPDPISAALFAFAAAHELRHLVLVASDWIAVPPPLLRQLRDHAARTGIDVMVYEDTRQPGFVHRMNLDPLVRHSRYLPAIPTDHTLVVSRRHYGVGSDLLADDKLGVEWALLDHLRRHPDASFTIEPLTADPDSLALATGDAGPNVVYKHVSVNGGKGVYFFKVRSGAEARTLAEQLDRRADEPPGYFQRFLRADGDRPSHVRAHVLCTPVGTAFLGAWRFVGPVPHGAPVGWGLVDTAHHFATNLAQGAHAELLPSEEAEVVRRIALEVAGALASALRQRFVTAG